MLGDTIIINFHGIGEPDRPVPDDETPYWISEARYEAILDRIADARDRRRYLITFDDGNMSDVAIGLPGLRRRGLAATFFVLAGMLDERGFLDPAAVRTLAREGMGVGTHGLHHPAWPDCDDARLDAELDQSCTILGDLIAAPITEAAIPFGRYDRRVIDALRRRPFRHVYTSDCGLARARAWLRPRTSIRCDMDEATVAAVVAGQRSLPMRVLDTARVAVKRRR
ncbi:polysaccharide deacetylase family protein [Sphingomonas sp. CFBP8993]|uniref:polysaccharide deacetylase family protein n=1 Tax=Sphingomonas sp. CFBP8993 TaxID=3096526 RepID=UPI002A69C235|nr:polysaccharide deacetylase family protein [Sphingomonas sp. CFBP8993]MDY0958875.1 polysaccharide deacetylase family protein [Sphingomonas sp. CFBP8993]